MDRGKRIEQIAGILETIRNGASQERAAGLVSLFAFAQTDPGALIDVLLGCLNLLRGGEITPADVNPYIPSITATWDRSVSDIQAFERQGDSEGRDADEYQKLSFLARIALDLLVYAADDDDARPVLRQALALSDPHVKMAAVMWLLRRGDSVDPADIESVASNPQVRATFWGELKKLQLTDVMPARWKAPAELAASDLTRWIAHPSEMGAPPSEIELMQTFPVETDEGEAEVYLFRFREFPKPWAPGEGWMAGIASRYLDGDRYESAWSSFDRWDAMSPEKHFEKLFYR